jgi:hypothetical protein
MNPCTRFLLSTAFLAVLALSAPARGHDFSIGFSYSSGPPYYDYCAPRTYVYRDYSPVVVYRDYAPDVVVVDPLPRAYYYRDYWPRTVVYRDRSPYYYRASKTYFSPSYYPSHRSYRHYNYAPVHRSTRIYRR